MTNARQDHINWTISHVHPAVLNVLRVLKQQKHAYHA